MSETTASAAPQNVFDLLQRIESSWSAFLITLEDLTEDQLMEPGAVGEWSLKEVLVHLCDFERVFNYRALRFSRGDGTPVEAFEQDPYIAASEANERPLENIVGELLSLRAATILHFASMSETMLDRAGAAGGNPVSVRALWFIIAGHCEGHLEDLRERFGRPH